MNLVGPEQVLALRAALLGGDDALRAFARWRSAISFDEIDSDTLRLVPRMYRNIRSLGGDDPILGRMKGVYRHTWVYNRLQLTACEELVGVLNGAGVSNVLLKGAAMLIRWTSDSGLRPMDDVDVLVRRDQARVALARLLSAGYIPIAVRADRFTDREFCDLHAASLRSPEGIYIDLHWRALMNGPAHDQDRAFWDRAQPIRLANSTTHVLSPEDHLYHTCAHAASSSNGARIDWAADAAIILREVGTQFDWDRFAAHARRDGIEFPVRTFVMLLRDVLNISVPHMVDRQLGLFRPALLARLDLALRRRARDRIGVVAGTFLALQDHRRQSAHLCRKSIFAAISPFIRMHWRFDSVTAALAYGLFTALGRPRRLRPVLASSARRHLLSARDLPDVGIGRIDFSLIDVERDPFIAGWSLPEAEGRWTDGHEAVLAMRIADPRPRDLPIRMKLWPFLARKKKLKVEVWADGHLVDLWRFSPNGPDWPWRTFTIDGKTLSQRDTIELTFVIRRPRSPLAAGLSADRRLLGLFVQSACFGYALREDAFERSLDFRASSADTELLWHGWSPPEMTGCWTNGPRAVVALRLPNRPTGDISVTLEASVFARREDRSGAPITISANGTHVGDINGLSPPTQHLRFTIPHTAIEDDNRLALTIDVPKPVMSADRKQRGLHLTRLTLSS